MIGDSKFHGKWEMGKRCRSSACDKIIPMCWHAYHDCKEGLFEWAGLPTSNDDEDDSRRFAAWLSEIRKKSDGGFGCKTINATHTFMWYYEKKKLASRMG
jgi:hypothetical protein